MIEIDNKIAEHMDIIGNLPKMIILDTHTLNGLILYVRGITGQQAPQPPFEYRGIKIYETEKPNTCEVY